MSPPSINSLDVEILGLRQKEFTSIEEILNFLEKPRSKHPPRYHLSSSAAMSAILLAFSCSSVL